MRYIYNMGIIAMLTSAITCIIILIRHFHTWNNLQFTLLGIIIVSGVWGAIDLISVVLDMNRRERYIKALKQKRQKYPVIDEHVKTHQTINMN